MGVVKKGLWVLVVSGGFLAIEGQDAQQVKNDSAVSQGWCHSVLHRHSWTMYPYKDLNRKKVNTFFKHIFDDIADTGKYIFTIDSLKVLTWTMPFYISTRFADNKVHSAFYDEATHTNKNQIPGPWSSLVLKDEYTAIPYVLYGLLGLMRSSDDKRRESQIFMAGLGWVYALKYVAKEVLDVDANLRPYNENFPKSPVHGGTPSGHTAMAVYMTTYLAHTEGLKGAIPMGLFSLFVASLSVTTNTHFLSQVIAGAGVGILMGLASIKVDRKWKDRQLELGVVPGQRGGVGISCAYNF